MSLKRDMSDSAKDFIDYVWPIVKNEIGGGNLISTEQISDKIFNMPFFKLVDVYSGIDAFQFNTSKGLRTIASRIQYGPYPKNYHLGYGTFTIRYNRTSGSKTEYEKRINSIINNDGWLIPYYTIQAYINIRNSSTQNIKKVLSVAIVKTKELYLRAKANIDLNCFDSTVYIKQNGFDGNLFLVIDWEEYKNECFEIITIYPKQFQPKTISTILP